MSNIQILTLSAFVFYTFLFVVFRLDSRIAGASALIALVAAMIALVIDDGDLAHGLATYAYCLLASAAITLTIEYLRKEPKRRLKGKGEDQTQEDTES